MTSDVLNQFVNRARRLYTLPAVAMRVVELTNQPTIDSQALKECIENDPAMTTKILRVVNSSLFGLSRQVTDLNQALALLGTKPLKLLVLGFSLPKELLSGLEADVLGRYWRRTVIKAVAAREIAEMIWHVPGDDAFIAGLLQDIGMLALIQDLGESYAAFVERVQNEAGDLLQLEMSTLGFDHTILSAELLDHWGLPESLVRDVSRPPDVETLSNLPADQQTLPQILHLSNLVADFLTQRRASLLNDLIDVGGRYVQLTMTQLESIIAALETKVPQLAEILSLQLPDDANYTEILAQAHVQLSEVADEATPELFHEEVRGLLAETQALSGAIGRFSKSVSEPEVQSVTRPPSQQTGRAGSSPVRTSTPVLKQTGEPGLLGRVAASVVACRQARSAVSLALMEIDNADNLILRQGVGRATTTVDRLRAMLESVIEDDGQLLQVDDFRFAAILDGCDRQPAVALARELVRCVRDSGFEKQRSGCSFSMSAGLATLAMPPKNFPCQELIDAAERCLHGVQLSGGDSVKSIDIY
jgi:HD-like signal output (HDOD) protein/GGDEF domain-containing protein